MSIRIAVRALVVAGIVAAASAQALGTPHARHAIKPAPRVTVTGAILLGSASGFSSVATVDRKEVFEAIPAVQKIRREKLSRSSARYRFLVVEANRVFQRALERVARLKGVDLVVTEGGVSAAGIKVVDLTAELKKVVD